MPHLLYVAIGFPPAAKSCAFRMKEVANSFSAQGWDVTALTIHRKAWNLEYGLDLSLEGMVDPRVEVVELPITRVDIEPDVSSYSWLRARHPEQWMTWRRRLEQLSFPEPVFGSWRWPLIMGVERIQRRKPVDLIMVSPAPYTSLVTATHLNRRYGIPYVVDFRDGWSINVLTGEEAFSRKSRRGRWEDHIINGASRVWFVNEPIRQFYEHRYPQRADRFSVVRNGYDPEVFERFVARRPDLGQGLTFGYLGTVNFKPWQMKALLQAWRAAREHSELLAKSRLVWRGHMGAGSARAANSNAMLVQHFEPYGVSYGGPVAKADVGDAYYEFDALVLALAGGRYVTSGKVYEYLATGLPIMSAHEYDHAAVEVLADHPLWVRSDSLEVEDLTKAFLRTVEVVAASSEDDRARAHAHARRYDRRALIDPAVRELTKRFGREVPVP